jgi:hypothetical protein
MGLMQRRKGRAFEQSVATRLRAAFPGAVVRRTSQADGAYASDVVVEPPAPSVIGRVWWECHDAASPRPLDKLAQAERDTRHLDVLPVVVWHRRGARMTRVTLRLGTLLKLVGDDGFGVIGAGMVVELDLVDLLQRMADAALAGLIGAWDGRPVQTSAQEASP